MLRVTMILTRFSVIYSYQHGSSTARCSRGDVVRAAEQMIFVCETIKDTLL